MRGFMDLSLFSSKKSLLAIMLGVALTAQGVENKFVIRHLANEQNIIVLESAKKFLLLPVQENAPEGKINIVINFYNIIFSISFVFRS